MAIFYQHEIDDSTKLAVWKIEEEESFFDVPLQREIKHPHKRLQHLAGRYLLKYLFPHFPIHLIQIADTRKPFLQDEAYHFSISHCDQYAAAIVSKNNRVGIDIEVPTGRVEKIKNKFLHPDELLLPGIEQPNNISQKTIEQQKEYISKLTLLWSCKEAVFKWWSYGNVDFSEMIRLYPTDFSPEGFIKSTFTETEGVYDVLLQYKIFDSLCLVWTSS